MQIDPSYLSVLVLGLLGAFWRRIEGWMGRVDGRFDELGKRELACRDKFLTREEYDEGKKHVWEKFEKHDEKFDRVEERLDRLEKDR